MAQELEHVLPEAVFQDDNQYGVSYDQLTALAIRGIQEQQTEILELQALAASMTPKTGTH